MIIHEKEITLGSKGEKDNEIQIVLRHIHSDGSFHEELFVCESAIIAMSRVKGREGNAGIVGAGDVKAIASLASHVPDMVAQMIKELLEALRKAE